MFSYQSIMPASAREVFDWHERPGALHDLLPGGPFIKVERHTGGIRDGALVVLSIGIGPFRLRWIARHSGYVQGTQFVDEQLAGPFTWWKHTHRVEAIGSEQSLLIDRIEYALPGGRFVQWLAGPLSRHLLTRMFARRHLVTRQRLAAMRRPRFRRSVRPRPVVSLGGIEIGERP